jgi:hypothetical protein
MGWAPPGRPQHVEKPKQAHQRPHANEHITEVDKDRHQREGVRRQVLKLEAVVLQQREEEGGRQEREPN